MELKKTSESYSLVDATSIWNVNGSVHKETSGVLRINISVSNIESGEHIGNFNYSISPNNNINVNFDCGKNNDDAFFEYGNTLVDKIIAQLD